MHVTRKSAQEFFLKLDVTLKFRWQKMMGSTTVDVIFAISPRFKSYLIAKSHQNG